RRDGAARGGDRHRDVSRADEPAGPPRRTGPVHARRGDGDGRDERVRDGGRQAGHSVRRALQHAGIARRVLSGVGPRGTRRLSGAMRAVLSDRGPTDAARIHQATAHRARRRSRTARPRSRKARDDDAVRAVGHVPMGAARRILSGGGRLGPLRRLRRLHEHLAPSTQHLTLNTQHQHPRYTSSHRNRETAIVQNAAANAIRTIVGTTAPLMPMPRHVIASSPSTAHRAGTTSVSCCSHAGKMNVGTQAPPSITIISTASVVTPRADAGVLPSAATRRPNVAAIAQHAIDTARKPTRLPAMRTLKTIIAKANDTNSVISAMIVPLSVLPASSAVRDTGALRSRFHIPRWRSSSISTPRFAAANNRN